MYKIFEIICLGVIGLLEGAVLIISYLIGMVCLLITEVIGTKNFMRKFKKLNVLVITEFRDTIKSFKSLFEIV